MSVSEKRCKASNSEFKVIWPGLKRCMVCGFAIASEEKEDNGKTKYPKEDSLHSTYHGKFYKAKSEYGSSNVLEYKVLKEKEENLIPNLEKIKSYDISEDVKNFSTAIKNIYSEIDEVEKWVEGFRKSESSLVQVYAQDFLSSCSKIKELCGRVSDNSSVSEYEETIYEILPIYRSLFENIRNVMLTRGSNAIQNSDELNDITIPCFSYDIKDRGTNLENIIQIIPIKQTKVEGILNDLYTVEFTRSLRLWDMCKAHPRFEDYIALLWNTPKFRNFIRPYMTEIQFDTFVNKYKANRQLLDYNFKEAPFYFGRVKISDECDSRMNAKDKKSKCKGNCKKCPYGVRDLTYTEKLVDISEDDEVSDGSENSEEYKESARAMAAFGVLINK